MMENREISVQELAAYDNSYMLVDMRDDMSYAYGHLPEAVNIPEDAIRADVEQFAGKKVVIYCKCGEKSVDLVEWLCEQGIDAVGLKGGYLAWLLERSSKEEEEDTYHLDVEESLRKRFRKSIWCKFTKAVKEYELVKEGDKIAVCISGVTARTSHNNNIQNSFHIVFQFFVDPFFLYGREVTQMNTFRCILINISDKVLVNIFRHKWNHWCCSLADFHQCGVQCHVGIDLILFHSFCPETFSGTSYIPVTHLIHKIL